MIKNILNIVIRLVIIAVLLYISYKFYRYMTLAAKAKFDFEQYKISIIIQFVIFFFVGIALRFKIGLLAAIKKRNVIVNFIKLGIAAVILLSLTLIIIFYIFAFMYILVAIAIIAGVLFIESFEYKS